MIDIGLGVCFDRIKEIELEQLRFWRNDPKIMKLCRQYELISPLEQRRWYERQVNDPSISMFSIYQIAPVPDVENQLIGVCGLTSIDKHNRKAEFSLYIGPEYQRGGFGEKALKTLLHYGFNNLNLNKIWGESFEENPARELFKKLGFKEVGKSEAAYLKECKEIASFEYYILARDFKL